LKRNQYAFQIEKRDDVEVKFRLEVNGRQAGKLTMEPNDYRQFSRDLQDGTGRIPDFVLTSKVCAICKGAGYFADPFEESWRLTCWKCQGTGEDTGEESHAPSQA
jgi:hypothetical protein